MSIKEISSGCSSIIRALDNYKTFAIDNQSDELDAKQQKQFQKCVDQLQQKFQDLQMAIENYAQSYGIQYLPKNVEIQTLTEENKNFVSEINEYNKQLQEQYLILQDVNKVYLDKNKSLFDSEVGEPQVLEKQLKEQTNKLNEQKEINDSLKKKILKFQQNSDYLNNQIKVQNQKIQKLQEKVDKNQRNIDLITGKTKSMHSNCEGTINKNIQTFDSDLAAFMDDHEKQKSQLNLNLATLNTNLDTIQAELKQLNDKINLVSQRCEIMNKRFQDGMATKYNIILNMNKFLNEKRQKHENAQRNSLRIQQLSGEEQKLKQIDVKNLKSKQFCINDRESLIKEVTIKTKALQDAEDELELKTLMWKNERNELQDILIKEKGVREDIDKFNAELARIEQNSQQIQRYITYQSIISKLESDIQYQEQMLQRLMSGNVRTQSEISYRNTISRQTPSPQKNSCSVKTITGLAGTQESLTNTNNEQFRKNSRNTQKLLSTKPVLQMNQVLSRVNETQKLEAAEKMLQLITPTKHCRFSEQQQRQQQSDFDINQSLNEYHKMKVQYVEKSQEALPKVLQQKEYNNVANISDI